MSKANSKSFLCVTYPPRGLGWSCFLRPLQCRREISYQLFDIVERIPARRAAEMRRDDNIAELEERVVSIARLVVESVEAKAAQSAGGERLAQGVAVDLVGLRDIDQESSRFDDRKLASADEVASLVGAG